MKHFKGDPRFLCFLMELYSEGIGVRLCLLNAKGQRCFAAKQMLGVIGGIFCDSLSGLSCFRFPMNVMRSAMRSRK